MVHQTAKDLALDAVADLELDGQYEVVVQPIKKNKTAAQLGGYWGPWLSAVSEATGEDKDALARDLKIKFLMPIYFADHIDDEKPVDPLQAQWVELAGFLQGMGQQDKLKIHLDRISLSWASLDQMSRFMNDVDAHYANRGIALPFLDKFRRSYE